MDVGDEEAAREDGYPRADREPVITGLHDNGWRWTIFQPSHEHEHTTGLQHGRHPQLTQQGLA